MTRGSQLSALLLMLALTLAGVCPALADIPAESGEITTHLEFRGYSWEEEEGWLTFVHEERLPFILMAFRGGILIQSWFDGTEYAAEHSDEFRIVVNSLNTSATVMRFYIEEDGDLAMEAWYPGTYNKQTFSAFVDAWIEDSSVLLGSHYDALSTLIQ